MCLIALMLLLSSVSAEKVVSNKTVEYEYDLSVGYSGQDLLERFWWVIDKISWLAIIFFIANLVKTLLLGMEGRTR